MEMQKPHSILTFIEKYAVEHPDLTELVKNYYEFGGEKTHIQSLGAFLWMYMPFEIRNDFIKAYPNKKPYYKPVVLHVVQNQKMSDHIREMIMAVCLKYPDFIKDGYSNGKLTLKKVYDQNANILTLKVMRNNIEITVHTAKDLEECAIICNSVKKMLTEN